MTFKGPPEGVGPPQKPKFCALDPPSGPVWAHFVGKMGQMGVKKNAIFLKKYFLFPITPGRSPEGLGPSKPQN